jgi:transposase
MLLKHGARAILFKSKSKGVWCEQLLVRRPVNVATVALANKMARTALGVIGKGSTVPQDYAAMQQAA